MISEKIQSALNDQVAFEFHSAHIYLSMWSYLESIDLPGMANWMRIQYQEELTHAEKILDYVIERDGRAILLDWEAPPTQWSSPLNAFESALAHEQKVTARFNNLMELAQAEKDHASQIFLQWFVNEQVEEESSVKAIVQKLKMVGDSKAGMFQLDADLGQRTFSPPAQDGA